MLPLLLYIMLLIAAPAGVAVVIQHVFREHEDAAFLREALYIAVTLYSCISMWATGAYGVRALEEDAMQHKRVVERGYECQIRMLRTRLGDTQQDLAMARVAIHEYEMQKREAGVAQGPLAIFSKHSSPATSPEVSPWNTPKHLYVVVIPPPSLMGSPKRSYEDAVTPRSSMPRIGKPESDLQYEPLEMPLHQPLTTLMSKSESYPMGRIMEMPLHQPQTTLMSKSESNLQSKIVEIPQNQNRSLSGQSEGDLRGKIRQCYIPTRSAAERSVYQKYPLS